MKKMLYYTCRDMTSPGQGINKKINEQIEAFRKAEFEVEGVYRKYDQKLLVDNGKIETMIDEKLVRPYKVNSSKSLAKYIENKKYDVAYIRYVFSDMAFISLLNALKKSGTKIIVEIPTFPYETEFKNGIENQVVLFLDRIYRHKLHLYVNRIVTYSEDKEIFGIPTIRTQNGIDFTKIIPVDINRKYDSETINIIAVADLARWHGYDRILEGLGQYYKAINKRNVMFHLVGDGSELENYKAIIAKWHIEEHVFLYGKKYGKELDEIYEKCDIAAECFGAHRKQLRLSSSLKSREYVAKGLPVIAAVDIDLFQKRDYPYFLRLPADETPVDIEKVIEFYDSVYLNRSKKEVVNAIRCYAQNQCDIRKVLQPIIDFYNTNM